MMLTTRGWRIKGWVWHTFAKQLWAKIHADDLINRAAILSFYFLLALFPLLLFLMALLGSFAGSRTELRRNLLILFDSDCARFCFRPHQHDG